MADTLTFTGESGKKYVFDVYPSDADFPEFGAVYVITRRYKHTLGDIVYSKPIYIGECEDVSKHFDNHPRINCFKRKNWNCICIHKDDTESSRLKKERDLIDQHHPFCN